MLDQAFNALKTYVPGVDPSELSAIGDAVVASHGNPSERGDLERRLCAALEDDVSRDAKDYICRQLRVIGTAASVPPLAAMLTDAELSQLARYALESMPAPEAGQALREALPKCSGALKAGVIGSLGNRKDAQCVPALAKLINDSDAVVAQAAACALGDIGTAEAVAALASATPVDARTKQAATDASLVGAESLLKAGDKAKALAVYQRLAKGDEPKHVRLAATRGMLACRS